MDRTQDFLATDPADFRKVYCKERKTMSTVIDAGTARWAGLQIDLHSKFRSGNLTPDQLEWWLNQSRDTRDALMVGEKLAMKPMPPSEPTEKFAVLMDHGIITVPDDYDHSTALTKFQKKHQGGRKNSFAFYNEAITDENFPNPTRILKPGDKLWVRSIKQVVPWTTTSEERMAFLATHKAVHVGAQGASLVFEQKRDQLPKGKWYASFDEPDRLWKDAGSFHWVPLVFAYSDGDFRFNLGGFESVWSDDFAFFCFRDLNSKSSVA